MRYPILFILLAAVPLLHGCPVMVATGVGGALAAGEDPRTIGTITEDEGIELKAEQRISQKYPESHVNVTSYNRMVLLTGEASDETTRGGIESAARAVENVRGVYNEIAVAGVSSLTSRTNDTLLTTKVKAGFVNSKEVDSLHIKIVTEAGVVYLFGLVKHKEADAATEIARTTSGVRKVVKLFEYLD
ncbi:MAG TPA: BON domain-containing protein [Burkholderiales bacterium]|nr:BON domain-containing protein [Burkholderiales bacterium]